MAVGIICEYDPFHKGHRWQLAEARRLSGDPDAVCFMSGNFTERGEAAIADKWVRARMALEGGADLVIELPTVFAAAGAADFARGAVALMEASGLISSFSFGTEEAALPALRPAAELLASPDGRFEEALRRRLPESESFARARFEALRELLPGALPAEAAEALAKPNAILALEYLKENLKLPQPLEAFPVIRRGAGHGEKALAGEGFCSATALREFCSAAALREASLQGADLAPLLPEECTGSWSEAVRLGLAPVRAEAFSAPLHHALTALGEEGLRQIPGVAEGLEHRILREAGDYPGWEELLGRLATKRYPDARLRRILLYALLGLTEDAREHMSFAEGPGYLRVLGFRKEKETLLGELCRKAKLPVVTSVSRALEEGSGLSDAARAGLAAEVRFTDLYLSALPDPAARGRGYEYRAPLVII